ncbi:hypothetical protein H5410_022753 [Solanum commersonii]|uniref:Uncharacterized protein n=1 Tax=Solanum commersonii TaxID=4109 RepID=A0A9J5ZI24_SOLCO|nr:hypothetical protein H5410_022753 [Solanum commersonii]
MEWRWVWEREWGGMRKKPLNGCSSLRIGSISHSMGTNHLVEHIPEFGIKLREPVSKWNKIANLLNILPNINNFLKMMFIQHKIDDFPVITLTTKLRGLFILDATPVSIQEECRETRSRYPLGEHRSNPSTLINT